MNVKTGEILENDYKEMFSKIRQYKESCLENIIYTSKLYVSLVKFQAKICDNSETLVYLSGEVSKKDILTFIRKYINNFIGYNFKDNNITKPNNINKCKEYIIKNLNNCIYAQNIWLSLDNYNNYLFSPKSYYLNQEMEEFLINIYENSYTNEQLFEMVANLKSVLEKKLIDSCILFQTELGNHIKEKNLTLNGRSISISDLEALLKNIEELIKLIEKNELYNFFENETIIKFLLSYSEKYSGKIYEIVRILDDLKILS